MKNPTPIAVPFALAATSLLHAQEFTENLTNIPSTDGLGSSINVVYTQPIGQSLITNISWTDVVGDGSSSGSSWGNEMRMDVNGEDIQFFPAEGSNSPGGIWGPASGSLDVSIPVDGDLRIEFYESYDDLEFDVDAIYTGGSITITYVSAGDCNENGIADPDELSIETDCDSNGTLDECELINDDCDENGVLDTCEIAPESDCDSNGIYDACELAVGDCDDSGVLDVCELTPESDCDSSGFLDVCEIEIFDCNQNGVLDSCESPQTEISFDTGLLDGGEAGPTYTFEADGNWERLVVEMEFDNVDGDLTYASDLSFSITDPNGICVDLGGTFTDVFSCGLAEDAYLWPAGWETNVSGTYAVLYQVCGLGLSGSGTWTIALTHGYSTGTQDQWSGTMTFGVGEGTVIDCNQNGVDDAEEISPATDCNSDGVLDECQVESGDCNANGVLDSCEGLGSTETELAFDTGLLNGTESVVLPVALSGSLSSLGVQLDFNNPDADATYAGDLLIQLTSPAGDCIEVGGFAGTLFNCGDTGVAADFDASWDVEASGPYAFTFPNLSLCNTTEGDWEVQFMHGYTEGLADQWSGTLTIGTITDDSGPVCPEDLDGNGSIDFNDIVRILSGWGPCSGCPEDLDGNNDVGFSDLVQILANFGPC